MKRVVLDTDVMVAALRSGTGASAHLLRQVLLDRVRLLVSLPLFLEYEAVLTRPDNLRAAGLSRPAVEAALADLARIALPVDIHFAWRPQLPDADDEMVLETAINGRADALVTFNRRDYGDAPARFGIAIARPGEFLGSLTP